MRDIASQVSRDGLLIVLTANRWLHAGVAALLPEIVCIQMDFSASHLPEEVGAAGQVFVAVDSLIMFQGEWAALHALQKKRPDATVVWLTRGDTGRLFPAWSRGDRILDLMQETEVLRLAVKRILQRALPLRSEERVGGNDLTLTERYLLPYFFSGLSINSLSRLTGKAGKTLYTHRQKILGKTGFRQLAFLQFVYERNCGLPGMERNDETERKRTAKNVLYHSYHP